MAAVTSMVTRMRSISRLRRRHGTPESPNCELWSGVWQTHPYGRVVRCFGQVAGHHVESIYVNFNEGVVGILARTTNEVQELKPSLRVRRDEPRVRGTVRNVEETQFDCSAWCEPLALHG